MSANPRRLLLTTDAVGGVWVYSMELAHALARQNTQIVLAVLGPPLSLKQRQELTALPHVSLAETDLPLDWMAPEKQALERTAASLSALARQHQVDLVQLHSPAWAGYEWPVPVIVVAHSCVGTWWRAVRGEVPPPEDFQWRMAAVDAGLRKADLVIAPTQAFADLTQQVYGLRRHIKVVHNARASVSSQARPRTGIPRTGILAAGRLWDEAKDIATLDAAAAMLGGIAIAVAGPRKAPHGAEITLRAVNHLGALDAASMRDTMASACIFASPAIYEPFGLAVLEAAQAGLALVLADIPSARELWRDAAVFVPPRQPQAWAATLRRLHGDPAACASLGQRARTQAMQYGTERFGLAMAAQYRHLLTAPAFAEAAP